MDYFIGGYIQDKPDVRDYKYENIVSLKSSQNSIDLRDELCLKYMIRVRYLESDPNIDSGATLRGICKASTKYGTAAQTDFPENSSYSTKPSFDSLARADDNKFNYLGQTLDTFIIRNSWGETWGDNGYCYIPAAKMMNYDIFDMWAVVRDTLYSDNENNEYRDRVNRLMPFNVIVIGNKAYDLDYANSSKNFDEIKNTLAAEAADIFIRDNNGRWLDFNGNVISIPDLTFPIYYKDKNGNSAVF